MRAPMSFFDQTPVGADHERFDKNIDVIDMNISLFTALLHSNQPPTEAMESVSRSPVFSHFQESLTASSVIIGVFTERFVIQNESLVDKNNTSAFAFMTAQRWLAVRVELIGNFVHFCAGLFAGDWTRPGLEYQPG
ncbi:hypothetical protein BV898_16846 [Hypsibius exemplaris]|uniref:ABC transmembrane type-1 domain-containing protein n=1 Tax=Hypsibius exemplaris TaxID=2072580 RepID=A0A9X6NEF7_HYPEX|nr:hypothetical protein BV898_16846 [Hypsibius exemplaris]